MLYCFVRQKSPLNTTQELKDYLEIMYISAAQYDNPPNYPVESTCSGIDGAPEGTDILGRIAAGLANRFRGFVSCNNVFTFEISNKSAWDWQVYISDHL